MMEATSVFFLCQHVTHLFTHQSACRTDAAACFTEQKLSGILQPGRKKLKSSVLAKQKTFAADEVDGLK